MSGGSFGYLADRFESGNPLDFSTLELLKAMSDWLNEPEQDQPEAARELLKIYKELSQISEKVRKTTHYGSPFYKLVHAAEWWCSNDYGINNFLRDWEEYKETKK